MDGSLYLIQYLTPDSRWVNLKDHVFLTADTRIRILGGEDLVRHRRKVTDARLRWQRRNPGRHRMNCRKFHARYAEHESAYRDKRRRENLSFKLFQAVSVAQKINKIKIK